MGASDPFAQTPEFQAIASRLGISNEQATSAADALLPAIMGGFQKQMQGGGSGGMPDLGGLLGMLGGGLFGGSQPEPADGTEHGNEVLGQIFGSKDVSRSVAQHASEKTGLDSSLLQQMLPMLVSLVTSFLAKNNGGASSSQGGGLAGMLGGLLGGGGGAQSSSSSPASGLLAMLDTNGDGNPLDDILRMVGK